MCRGVVEVVNQNQTWFVILFGKVECIKYFKAGAPWCQLWVWGRPKPHLVHGKLLPGRSTFGIFGLEPNDDPNGNFVLKYLIGHTFQERLNDDPDDAQTSSVELKGELG